MAVEEPSQRGRRHPGEGARVGRPDRRAQRHQVPLHEPRRPPTLGQQVVQRVLGTRVDLHQRLGPSVESGHVGQHAQELRAAQVASLGEDGVGRGPPVLEPGAVVAQRKAHVARLGGHLELVQQADQAGIGPFVVDDEAGVHGQPALGQIERHGVGVAPRPVVGLEEGDLVVAMEQVAREQPRDPGADDGDAQGPLFSTKFIWVDVTRPLPGRTTDPAPASLRAP